MASSADRDMKEVVVSSPGGDQRSPSQPPPYESPAPDPRGTNAPEAIHPAHAASSSSPQPAAYPSSDAKHGGISPQTTGASAYGGDRGPVSPQVTGAGAPHDPSSFGHPQQPPPAAQYPGGHPSNYSQPAQPAPAHQQPYQPYSEQQQQYAQQQQQQLPTSPSQQQGHPMQEMKTNQSGRQQFRNTVPLQALTSAPAPVQCPSCGAVALTHTDIQVGMFTHAIALAVCFFTCLGCIPYCISGFKDVEHKCGNCGVRLAMWHRSGRTEVMMYN